mgnify:CR=1 FL=1
MNFGLIILPGAGAVKAAGRATEQTITINGAASYEAGDLESQRVKVTLHGLGSAIQESVQPGAGAGELPL